MNLWFRLLLTFLVSRSRGSFGILETCVTPFHVMPTDLDLLGHVNNGVYFQLMDLARLDFLLRTGTWTKFKSRGWFAVVAAETVQFHRELRLLQKFFIETRWIGADEKTFYVAHRIIRDRAGGPAAAEATIRALLVSRTGGTVPMSELLTAMGNPQFPQPLAPWILEWSRSLDKRRQELTRG